MEEKISREERILGLSRIWRDVKYCFARFYEVTSEENWDALYCEYLPLVAEAEDMRCYYELLLRFVATLNDGHTYVLVPDEIRPPYNIAIGTTYIDGKHILVKAPKNYEDFLLMSEQIQEVAIMPTARWPRCSLKILSPKEEILYV